MVFDGNPCVSQYISEEPKQAIDQVSEWMRDSKFSVHRFYNVETESLSFLSDPATPYCHLLDYTITNTTYWTTVG